MKSYERREKKTILKIRLTIIINIKKHNFHDNIFRILLIMSPLQPVYISFFPLKYFLFSNKINNHVMMITT